MAAGASAVLAALSASAWSFSSFAATSSHFTVRPLSLRRSAQSAAARASPAPVTPPASAFSSAGSALAYFFRL